MGCGGLHPTAQVSRARLSNEVDAGRSMCLAGSVFARRLAGPGGAVSARTAPGPGRRRNAAPEGIIARSGAGASGPLGGQDRNPVGPILLDPLR